MGKKLCILSQFHVSLLLIAFGRMVRKITLYPRFHLYTPHLLLLICHCGRLFIWMHNLSFLFAVIIGLAGCGAFAPCYRADDASRDATSLELCGTPAMSELVGLASKLAGLPGIGHIYAPLSCISTMLTLPSSVRW